MLSWYIHSGYNGYEGLSEEAIEEVFFWAHIIAQQVFIEATLICAEELKISKVIERFRDMVYSVRLIPVVLLEEQIKILREAKTK